MYRTICMGATIGTVAMAFVFSAPRFATADLIAYDNFEAYTPNADAIGQNGGSGYGTGWSGDWTKNTQTTIHNIESNVISGYSQSLTLGGSGNLNNVIERAFPSQGNTVYFGFVVRTVGLVITIFFNFT